MVHLDFTLESGAIINCHRQQLVWMVECEKKLVEGKGKLGLHDVHHKLLEISWITVF